MRLKPWIIVVITMILFVASGCTKNEESIKERIQKEFPSDFQNEGILHAEMIGNGLLVFFKNNEGLGTGFFKQQSNNWEWVTGSGYTNLNPDGGLSVIHSNMDEIALYFSYGVITDPDIFEVQSLENKAKIIQMSGGTRIWFITYENSIGQNGALPPTIIGLSKEGEQIITIPD
ncbi:hypothetical protein ACFPYJ_24855 [Paenibacillus solisilvae]|uniref:Lipoprotein n=1 Tax=Paenibacillus solisilvae TaxID=2486751 RepID=A0ABW0W5G9_9BACL